MICPRCGNQIADTVKFCPACGNPVAAAAIVKDREEVFDEDVKDKECTFNGAEGGPEGSLNGTTEKKKGQNGFAIAALVLGLVAIPFGFILLIPNILAVIFGVIGITKASSAGTGKGMSTAGLIIGIVAALLWIAVLAAGIALLGVVINIMNF